MNWRLGLLVLLGVAIVVVLLGAFRGGLLEGFQTTPPTSRAVVENSVFIVNPDYITGRFPSGAPANLSSYTGKLIKKRDAYALCSRLGATMARIDDVRKAKRVNKTWTENGWVDDLDKPIKMTEVSDSYEGREHNPNLYGAAQQDVSEAYAICIGPDPTGGATLPNGFSIIPSTVAELPTLVKSGAEDTATTFTIFDPTAAYIQADIVQMEYPAIMTDIYRSDKCKQVNNNYTDASIIKQITQYFWWVQNYSDFDQSMYTWYSWIYKRSYRGMGNIESAYWTDYFSRVTKFAARIADRFKSHPISFIVKDYESIKTPEFIESVNSGLYTTSTTRNLSTDYAECDLNNHPADVIKTQKIDFSFMPSGYPDPGFLCIPANDDLSNPASVFRVDTGGSYGDGGGMNVNKNTSKDSMSCKAYAQYFSG